MGKLTLSVDDGIVERAKAYAERHRTSVSAMVGEYLAEITSGVMPLGEAVHSGDIKALEEFNGRILTDVDGPIRTTPQQRQVAAYLDNGWLLVWEKDPLSPHVMALKSMLRKLGHEVKRQVLLDLATIRQVYERAAGDDRRARDVTRMQKEFLDLVARAAENKATDIHIVVQRYEATVRFRIDDRISEVMQLPAAFGHDLLASAFNMADASDASYRPYEYQGARVSGINTPLPEGVQAVRLQFNPLPDGGRYGICHLLWSHTMAGANLAELGYSQSQIDALNRATVRRFGLHLIAGPTGAGKSTTLATLLANAHRNRACDRNIISVEDPVEYRIVGCQQMPVLNACTAEERNEKYRQAVTAALSSDPDVLMVGEIRDRAVASLALKAAMTGRPVFAAMHSNSALSLLPRLRDLAIEDYILADDTLIALLACQRLVPTVCPHCRVPLRRTDHPDLFDWLESRDADAPRGAFLANRDGCELCRRGYTGRTVVAEVIEADAALLRAVALNGDMEAARAMLAARGVQTMLEHAIEKVKAGLLDPRDVQDRVGL